MFPKLYRSLQGGSLKSRVDERLTFSGLIVEDLIRTTLPSIILLAVMTAITTGCGGTSPVLKSTNPSPSCKPATHPTFAYVLNDADATISMYTVNSCSGALTPNKPPTIPTGVNNGFNAESMTVDAAARFLYVANLGSNATDAATISMFTIDHTTGLLMPTSPAMVPTGFFPQGIAIDPAGKFVYTANSDDNSVSMFTVDQQNGVLTATSPASTFVPSTQNSTYSSPDFVSASPSGQYLYVTDQDSGAISSFAIDATTGLLTATNPAVTPAGIDPWQVVLDPTGKFAYVPDRGFNNVWMYTVDPASGALVPNSTPLVAAGNQPAYMAIEPSGKSAYVVNRIDGTISMYTIDATNGTLSPKTPAVVAAGNGAYPIAIDAPGTFAYVGNQGEATVSIYKIDNHDGVLTSAGTASTGNNPVAIAVTH